MEVHPAFVLVVVLSCFASASYAHNVHLSTLNQSLIVTTSTSNSSAQALKAGVDSITIRWSYNTNLTVTAPDTNYTTVEAKLCYAPVSQTGRDDRKTDDNLDFDKTCPVDITEAPYKRANKSFVWNIPNNTTTATYFVRVYVINARNHEIAYGDSTNALKTTNLVQVDGVVSDEKASSASSVFGTSFGYRYAWLLAVLFLV